MAYQCVTTSIAGFIQQLAVGYCAKGYHFYALGEIPPEKDPAHVDAKLVERYGVDLSYTTRCRRKQQGAASVQYVRYNDVFVLIATHGIHRFWLNMDSRELITLPLVRVTHLAPSTCSIWSNGRYWCHDTHTIAHRRRQMF
jgi:hypothetical protein